MDKGGGGWSEGVYRRWTMEFQERFGNDIAKLLLGKINPLGHLLQIQFFFIRHSRRSADRCC